MSGSTIAGVAIALPSLGISFLMASLLFLVLTTLAWFQNSYRRRGENGREEMTMPRGRRLGGGVLILVFWTVLLFDSRIVFSPPLLALLLGSIAILLFGLADDFFTLSWSWQLLFQVSLALGLVFFGFRIDIMQGPNGGTWDLARIFFPGAPTLVFVLWLILIMNAVNWLDGLDGLLGGVMLVGFSTLFSVSLFPEVTQPTLTVFAGILMGALIAFLLSNWYPARLLAGTTGAYFLGFMLATLSVFAGAKVATTLLVLTVPILDALFVLFERLRMRTSPFLPDKSHLHYRLIALGWSVRNIALLYIVLTASMAFLALYTRTLGKLVVFGIASVIILGFCFVVSFALRQQSQKEV